MLKNYLTLALRDLSRHKISSFINITGLAFSIGCCILVYLLAQSELTKNKTHEKGKHIYQILQVHDYNGEQQTWGSSPALLGPTLESDLAQVTQSVRLADWGGVVVLGENQFGQNLRFVDPGFFDLFTYPMKYGNQEALFQRDNIILSEAAAFKYFGDTNPVGQQLLLESGDQFSDLFTVGGVAERFPANEGLGFEVLLNYNRLSELQQQPNTSWSDLTTATFIHLNNPNDAGHVTNQLAQYIDLQNDASDEPIFARQYLANLVEIPHLSTSINYSVVAKSSLEGVIIFSILALFLLTLSCINYLNISLTNALYRLKEIGVRKAMGGRKSQLVFQFLAENIVLCFIALVTAIVITRFVLLPVFNELGSLSLTMSLTENSGLWGFFIAILLTIALASGSYPAFYISSFKPVSIFRGNQKGKRKRRFMHSFMTFQFVLAIITMIASIALTFNGFYLNKLDWGYNQQDILVVQIEDQQMFNGLQNQALQQASVLQVAGTQHHIATGGEPKGNIQIAGENMESVIYDVGDGYLETMNLRLQQGNLNPTSDLASAIVVNESFVKYQDWQSPIGQAVRIDSVTYNVAGVVADFHYDSFFEDINPVLFRFTEASNFNYLAIKTQPGAAEAVAESLRNEWQAQAPDQYVNFFFQEHIFDRFYQSNAGLISSFIFIALIALIISCLGLFGLVSQNISLRMREICIHKVLGANLFTVSQLINKRFLVLVGIAIMLATPISYYLLTALLDAIYSYHSPLGPLPFAIAFVLILGTAMLTIATQLHRIVNANPAEVLQRSV